MMYNEGELYDEGCLLTYIHAVCVYTCVCACVCVCVCVFVCVLLLAQEGEQDVLFGCESVMSFLSYTVVQKVKDSTLRETFPLQMYFK